MRITIKKCVNEFKPIINMIKKKNYNTKKNLPTEIGRGGFGVVYLNKTKSDKFFVTKKNDYILDIKKLKIAYNEINFLLICKNKNIPKLYNYNIKREDNYFNYIINMEYFQGDDLYNLIYERKKKLNIIEIFKYIKDISETLNYIHNLGFIYCDLKLENIIITKYGAKIVDFGQVRKKNCNSITQITTPSYLPIECIYSKKNYVEKSDYWCLGIILIIMIYNIHPFYNNYKYTNYNNLIDNSDSIINNIFNKCNPSISIDYESLGKVQDLIFKLINHDIQKRYGYKELKYDFIWFDLFDKSYNDI